MVLVLKFVLVKISSADVTEFTALDFAQQTCSTVALVTSDAFTCLTTQFVALDGVTMHLSTFKDTRSFILNKS